MFRLNHQPLRELVLVKGEEDERSLWVQYVNENTFNVYAKDENGFMTPIILDAECHMSES